MYPVTIVMDRYIDFRTKICKYLRLNVHHDAQFNDLLATLRDIKLPETSIDQEQIMFSVLELINNSLRAHREKKIIDDISLLFAVDVTSLKISVQDHGGGFDPEKLPYNLGQDINEVDLHDERFQKYRESNSFKRFGMGLYITKKTFDYFSLSFLDFHGEFTAWHPEKVKSTRIELGVYFRGQNND